MIRTVLLLLCSAALPAMAQPIPVAVLDTAVHGVAPELGVSVHKALAARAEGEHRLQVTSLDDVRRLLRFEAQRQLVGCEAGTCATAIEVGRTLGVRRLLLSSIGKVGKRLQLSVAWVEVTRGEVLRREVVEIASAEEVPDAARALLDKVLLGRTVAAAATGPRTIAILYFDNTSGSKELAPLRKGLADLLITRLATAKGLTVVEREKLEAIRKELELQHSGSVAPATVKRLGKLLGAERLVFGSYMDLMGMLQFTARVVLVETGAVESAAKASGKRDDFLGLASTLADRIATALEAGAPSAALGKGRFSDVLAYSRVLERLDSGDRGGASQALNALLVAAPTFAPALALRQRLAP